MIWCKSHLHLTILTGTIQSRSESLRGKIQGPIKMVLGQSFEIRECFILGAFPQYNEHPSSSNHFSHPVITKQTLIMTCYSTKSFALNPRTLVFLLQYQGDFLKGGERKMSFSPFIFCHISIFKKTLLKKMWQVYWVEKPL